MIIRKTGIPLNGSLTLPAKVLRDAAPIFNNAAQKWKGLILLRINIRFLLVRINTGLINNSEVLVCFTEDQKNRLNGMV